MWAARRRGDGERSGTRSGPWRARCQAAAGHASLLSLLSTPSEPLLCLLVYTAGSLLEVYPPIQAAAPCPHTTPALVLVPPSLARFAQPLRSCAHARRLLGSDKARAGYSDVKLSSPRPPPFRDKPVVARLVLFMQGHSLFRAAPALVLGRGGFPLHSPRNPRSHPSLSRTANSDHAPAVPRPPPGASLPAALVLASVRIRLTRRTQWASSLRY